MPFSVSKETSRSFSHLPLPITRWPITRLIAPNQGPAMSDTLLNEKRRIFSIPLTDEELAQIATCRTGILSAVAAGSGFGFFCGRMALGHAYANVLVKALVLGSKNAS